MTRFLTASLAATTLALAALSLATSAPAAPVSFTGDLANDNDVVLLSFTLAADADVTLRTWSYAGGTNAAGSLVAAGGFDPVVALFAGSGNSAVLIDGNDDGSGVATDPGSGRALDALLRLILQSGTYTLALSQVANFANGPLLGDGFLGAGNPGFGGRSSHWALDVLGADLASTVPEPGALALVLLGLAALSTQAARSARPRSLPWRPASGPVQARASVAGGAAYAVARWAR